MDLYIEFYIGFYPGLRQQPATAQTFWLSDKNFTSFGCVFAYLCLFAAGICADGCGRPAQGSSCKLLNATAESVGHFGSKLGDLGTQNPSKMLSKYAQNRPKIDENRVLEDLGPQEPQEAQNDLQKAVRVPLLGSLLETHLGPCWAQKTQKFDLEGIQKKHQLGHRFFIDFETSWTSFW